MAEAGELVAQHIDRSDRLDPFVRGYRRAAKHLLAAGLLPAPCRPELQELWANSAEDRALVEEIVSRWEISL
jgi:hypothetical protein